MKLYLKIFFSIILLVVLAVIISRSVDVRQLWHLILNFSKEKLLILCTISFIISVLKAWRFMLLLNSSSIPISFWDNLKISIAGQAMSPIPGGEASRGLLIKKEMGTKLSKTAGPIVLQAYMELFSAAIVGLIGSLFLKVMIVPVGIIFILLIIFGLLLINPRIFKKIRSIHKIKLLHFAWHKLWLVQKQIKATVFDPDLTFIRSLAINILADLVGGVLIFLTAYFLNINLSILQAIFIYAVSVLIQGLAISPGGIGFTEGGVSGILLALGIGWSPTLALVLIYRVVTLVFYILTGTIFLSIFYGKSLLNSDHGLLAKG